MSHFCILQVEDTEEDRLLMQLAFKRAEITNVLHAVRDGREAINYLAGIGNFADRQKYPLPCLVLLDLKLPQVMGLDVLRWIRRQPNLQTLPVIVWTSSGQRYDIDDAYRAGANSFLIKPSGIHELVEMLLAIKVYWLRYNEAPSECLAGSEIFAA